MKYLNKAREYLLLFGVFTLPIYQTINHWFFGLFIFFSFVEFFQKKEIQIGLKQIGRYILLSSFFFFLLRLMFLFHSTDINLSQKELTRALPFLLYPLGILSLNSNANVNYKEFEKNLFWALTIGCFVTAVLCWANVAINMEDNPVPANKFFGWKKSGSHLTAMLDLHPPYLGMLFFGSIVFLFREAIYNSQLDRLKKIGVYFLILFLMVFLFNLTARNSLLFLVLIGFIFFLYKKYWKMIVLSLIMVLSAIVLIINHPSKYYRLKMYHMLSFSDKEEFHDKRFERLVASYNVFRQSPLMGVGLGRDINLKVKQYNIMGDDIAVKKRLNSHNQFFEYLAAYGVIGGLVFLLAILTFIFFLIKNKYYFYLLLFLNIVFASITESIFERALGIQYYSLIISMALLKYLSKNNSWVKSTENGI